MAGKYQGSHAHPPSYLAQPEMVPRWPGHMHDGRSGRLHGGDRAPDGGEAGDGWYGFGETTRRWWWCWLGAGKHGGREQRWPWSFLDGHGGARRSHSSGVEGEPRVSQREWRARALDYHAHGGKVANGHRHRSPCGSKPLNRLATFKSSRLAQKHLKTN